MVGTRFSALRTVASNTTVVNSVVVWHHILSNEGGHSVADSGPEGAQIVDGGVGGGGRTSFSTLYSLRSTPAGQRLFAGLTLGSRAQELLAVGRSGGQRHTLWYPAFSGESH